MAKIICAECGEEMKVSIDGDTLKVSLCCAGTDYGYCPTCSPDIPYGYGYCEDCTLFNEGYNEARKKILSIDFDAIVCDAIRDNIEEKEV